MNSVTVPGPEIHRIADRRIALGLTQARLATRSGVSLSMISRIEQGWVPQYSRTVSALLETLDEAERLRAAP